MPRNKTCVIHDDAREALGRIAPGSVDAVVTDPPYQLGGPSRSRGFMGMAWDGGAVAFDPRIWDLCLRAVRPGAYLLAFGGTQKFHRLATAIEDGGWTIRDAICWHYGNGVPKHKGSMKPATELICVARVPLDGTIGQTVERHGTGRLWPECCRVPLQQGERLLLFEKHPDRRAQPLQVNAVLPWSSRRVATDFRGPCSSGAGPVDPAGRWPGNVVHDGSNAVLDLFLPAPGQQAAVPPSRASDPVAYASSSRGREPRLRLLRPLLLLRQGVAARSRDGSGSRGGWEPQKQASDGQTDRADEVVDPSGVSGGRHGAGPVLRIRHDRDRGRGGEDVVRRHRARCRIRGAGGRCIKLCVRGY